jgi:hypothetical protein
MACRVSLARGVEARRASLAASAEARRAARLGPYVGDGARPLQPGSESAAAAAAVTVGGGPGRAPAQWACLRGTAGGAGPEQQRVAYLVSRGRGGGGC